MLVVILPAAHTVAIFKFMALVTSTIDVWVKLSDSLILSLK